MAMGLRRENDWRDGVLGMLGFEPSTMTTITSSERVGETGGRVAGRLCVLGGGERGV